MYTEHMRNLQDFAKGAFTNHAKKLEVLKYAYQ